MQILFDQLLAFQVYKLLDLQLRMTVFCMCDGVIDTRNLWFFSIYLSATVDLKNENVYREKYFKK